MSNLDKAKELLTLARDAHHIGENTNFGMAILHLDRLMKELSQDERIALEKWLSE